MAAKHMSSADNMRLNGVNMLHGPQLLSGHANPMILSSALD